MPDDDRAVAGAGPDEDVRRSRSGTVIRVGDHLRPVADALEPGVYRVVGTGTEIALLRVADGDGRRVHTGELRHVETDVISSEFEEVPDPDAGFTPVRALRNGIQGLYWQFRKFL